MQVSMKAWLVQAFTRHTIRAEFLDQIPVPLVRAAGLIVQTPSA